MQNAREREVGTKSSARLGDSDQELQVLTMPNRLAIETLQSGWWKWRMRGIVNDWLLPIAGRNRSLSESLFLAANIVDRFLSKQQIEFEKAQLIWVTSLFIAAKYEEIMCPSVRIILHCAEGNYDEADILRAETLILKVLDWDLSYPGPLLFLRRISRANDFDQPVSRWLTLSALLTSGL